MHAILLQQNANLFHFCYQNNTLNHNLNAFIICKIKKSRDKVHFVNKK